MMLDLAHLPTCVRCPLHTCRTLVVQGWRGASAPPHPIMIVGEAPGATEDAAGVPFIGLAGKMLDEALMSAGVQRDELYITNAVKCRPPKNKKPTKKDRETCRAWLDLEIAAIQPGKIVLLGATAIETFFPKLKVGEARTRSDLSYQGIPMAACYHPSAALRDPGKRVPFFNDIVRAFGGQVKSVEEAYVHPRDMRQYDPVATDTETTFGGGLIGAALANKQGSCWISYPDTYGLTELDSTLLLHNAKFDLDVLDRYGWLNTSLDKVKFHDTMIMAYLLRRPRLGLKDLAESELGLQVTRLEDLTGGKLPVEDVPRDLLASYCRQDTRLTWLLYDKLSDELYRTDDLPFVYENIDLPLVPVLIDMERTGITIDVEYLQQLGKEFREELTDLTESMRVMTGNPTFNPNSTGQVARWLFDDLRLPVIKQTSGGEPSTDAESLKELERRTHQTEVVILRRYREISKLLSTYVEGLATSAESDPERRVHTQFNNCRVETGRLSSSGPNLQNIPARTELGRRIRRAFIPRRGWKLIKADQSQAELRIMSCLGHDEGLLKIFREDGDPHQDLANRLHVDRRTGKTTQYGVGYGMGPDKLARSLGISIAAAKGILSAFFQARPGIKRYLDAAETFLITHGYSRTVFGRRNYLPDVYSERSYKVAEAFREGNNMPIQGTDADIMRMVMRRVWDRLSAEGLEAKLLLQVHDELVLEAPPDEAEYVLTLVLEEADNILKPFADLFPIPIPMDGKILDNWAGAS